MGRLPHRHGNPGHGCTALSSNQDIVDDIRHGNSAALGAEPLRELLKLLPEEDEVEKIRRFRGDAAKLTMADAFFNLLLQLPSYSLRIQSMLLREEFPVSCESMKRDVMILRSSVKELMQCEPLHAVLHLVLQAGNILNAGGYAGNALGFKLSSLLSLADTKANKPGMNLLHFVALEAQKKDEKLLEFPLSLTHIQAAARISVETLDSELQRLTSRTRSVEENVREDPELLQQLRNFLQHADSSLSALRGGRQLLKKESGELLDFFCEDHDTFRLDDCFNVFNTFCLRFTDAVKENRKREAKEVARRQRVQDLEEQKRHSWAGGEKSGGAFGSRCSSESNMSTAMTQHDEAGLLVELLTPTPRPRSPRSRSPLLSTNSPLGRAGSLRRTRNSPCSSPSTVAERELDSYLEMALAEHEVAQQSKRAPASPEPGFKREAGASTMSNQTGLSVSELSRCPKDSNHATNAYLRSRVNQSTVSGTVDPTSDENQRSDIVQPTSLNLSSPLAADSTEKADGGRTGAYGDEELNGRAGEMSVVLEKCLLVPELKVFDKVVPPMSCTSVSKDLSESEDNLQVQKVLRSNQQLGKAEDSDMQSSTSLKEEEDKVVVWCVTGVCETNVLHPQHVDSQQTSPLELRQADEKPVPSPISSQPVPAPRCPDGGLPTSSPGVPPEAAGVSPPRAKETKSNKTEEQKLHLVVTKPEQSADNTNEDKTPSGQSGDVSPSSKLSTKNLPVSKHQTTVKPPKASTSPAKSKPVRTLIKSENPEMRRVLPISRTSRSVPTQVKRPEKPPSITHGLASTSHSRSTSNLHTSNAQRGGRATTATSSQRSSSHDTLNLKDRKDQRGSPGVTQEQSRDVQKKPPLRKTLKAKGEPEEKMCLSTLRALTGAGASLSAPATPLHKASTRSASPLPGFARNTASSSFRQTPATHTPSPARSLSPHPGSDPKPKATNSTAFTHTGSVRVTGTSRLSVVLSTPIPLGRSRSIRSSARSSLQDSKGQQKNESGNVSAQSSRSKESVKSARPSWR